jgi:hypothetical protein
MNGLRESSVLVSYALRRSRPFRKDGRSSGCENHFQVLRLTGYLLRQPANLLHHMESSICTSRYFIEARFCVGGMDERLTFGAWAITLPHQSCPWRLLGTRCTDLRSVPFDFVHRNMRFITSTKVIVAPLFDSGAVISISNPYRFGCITVSGLR